MAITRLDLYMLRTLAFHPCLQAEVIVVDIDGGHISIPDSTNLAMLPEPFLSRTRRELSLVSCCE